ncbi:MAG: beta-galactosidase [Clostridia bacterium]|nr:beta-galactosidase [Clostridia bacterium]
MLYSQEKCVGKNKRPHFSLWFGNFFEPYHSDRELVRSGMREIAQMGFNSIILDSKLWEDFTAFFRTGEESDYVAMQKFMIEQAAENGMGINFLTLFYNGDNLYPHIRDSAPDIIRPVYDRKGKPFRGLKHWDKQQTDALVEHTVNLYRRLAKSAAAKAVDENGTPKTPCYFYHSPALMPSFDEDGKSVYVNWLKKHYSTVAEMNAVYHTDYESFEDIDMLQVWPEMTAQDYREPNGNVRLAMYRDNMLFRQDLLTDFYRELTAGVRRELPDIFLYDCLSQWKYFLTDWVEISERGLDLWRLAEFLDSPSFYTLPADAYGEADCYAVSFENAILRSACNGKDPVAGLFLGRYLYNDIYAYVTPGESIASCYGAGATDMFFYGYSGLDDGGNFGKWDADRKSSVQKALDWFAAVREVSGKRLDEKKAAIVFPYASFTMDHRHRDESLYRASRNDLLGHYRQLADLGLNADILDRSQITAETLHPYKVVVLPADPFYEWLPSKQLEDALRSYVEAGGTVIAGASCGLHGIFDIEAVPHSSDSFAWEETVTDFAERFFAFNNAEMLASYCSDGACAIAKKQVGKGVVYATGLDFGRCYCERVQKPVPVAYGREAQYPLTMIRRTPIEQWLTDAGIADERLRGIERIRFENGTLVINHTPYDYKIEQPYSSALAPDGFCDSVLYGHKYVFLCD